MVKEKEGNEEEIVKLQVGKIVKVLLIMFLLYIAVSCIIPPLIHKKASGENWNQANEFQMAGASDSAERVLCIDDNSEALLWRLRVIEAAKDEIILSTFDFRDDNSGRDIMSALLNAAERGVKVKILVDGLNGMFLYGSDCFKALVTSPNVEAKLYNQINLLTPWKVNYRMHDKYLIADEMVYILGGRNTNDLFLGNYLDKYNIDRDILVYSESSNMQQSLYELVDYFYLVWELSCNQELFYEAKFEIEAEELRAHYLSLLALYPEAFISTEWKKETMETSSIMLLTNPIEAENKAPELWFSLCRLMEQGKEIMIQTPYIICSKEMYEDLSLLGSSGAHVQIITNAVESGANPLGCTDYLNQKDEILKTGAEVFECLHNNSLHTKTILVDDAISIVGSYNLDMRSSYLDTEMMLVIDCPQLNAYLREFAVGSMNKSKHSMPDGSVFFGAEYEPVHLPFGKSIIYGILRILVLPFRHLL